MTTKLNESEIINSLLPCPAFDRRDLIFCARAALGDDE